MRCYFCGNYAGRHTLSCVIIDKESELKYITGYARGIRRDGINSSDKYFIKGYICGMFYGIKNELKKT